MEPEFNQAEQMLRRVSPEGRALAHKERVERQRRTTKQLGLCGALAAVLLLALYALGQAGVTISPGLLLAAFVVFVAGCAGIVAALRPRSVMATQLPSAPLTALPLKTGEWLEQQRLALPPPALPIVDDLSRQLSTLTPQLAKLEPNGPGANAIRKLIGVELPELISRYRSIPHSAAEGDAGAQLLSGLKIIEGEVGRISHELASGSFDALATQNRYLQLKYDAGLSRV